MTRWRRASVQPTSSAPAAPPLSPHAFSDIVNLHSNTNGIGLSNDEPTTQQSKPGLFDRTIGLEEHRTRKKLADALMMVVDNSGNVMPDTPQAFFLETSSLAPARNNAWLGDLFGPDTLHKLFEKESMGNYVINRRTGRKEWEDMPIYARLGMHLLFYGPAAVRFVTWSWIRRILRDASIRQGKIYDSTDPKLVQSQIRSFVATYSIDLSELLEKDITKYSTFNSFFYRHLVPTARPPASPEDATIIGSAADSRLTVFNTIAEAKTFWVKGRQFTLPHLLRDSKLASTLGKSPSIAIWRLAPQDYHRFHSPVSGTLRKITHIPGEYYTVNPQAVNGNLDVFTANVRDVAVIDAKFPSKKPGEEVVVPVVLVAVGALLVGSIGWDKKVGEEVKRGDGLGYFAYGGSTVIGVFPQGLDVEWDGDLAAASLVQTEVLVRAGESIGRIAASKKKAS